MKKRKVTEITNSILNDVEIYEFSYPKLSSSRFTFRKHEDPKKKGKYIDDGVCEVCGAKGVYVLIADKKPKMCYKCYQAIRAYDKLLIDVLRLRNKKELKLADCKRIVKYMRTYAKKKTLIVGLIGAYLATRK